MKKIGRLILRLFKVWVALCNNIPRKQSVYDILVIICFCLICLMLMHKMLKMIRNRTSNPLNVSKKLYTLEVQTDKDTHFPFYSFS